MSSINQEKIKEGRPRSVFSSYHSDSNFDVDETEEEGLREGIPPWDVFKSFPTQTESGSMQNSSFFENTVRVLKVFIYGLLFIIVLCSSIVAKSAVLFATSQLQDSTHLLYCDYDSHLKENIFMTEHTQDGRVRWIWCLIFIFMVPECIGVLKTVWHYLFKRKCEVPKKQNILFMILIETLHTIGLVLFIFVILPEISVVQGAAIFGCLCFIPGLLNLLSRNRENQNLSTSKLRLYIILDALALVAQISGLFLWPLIHNDESKASTWIFPIALILCSIRWWGNYVSFYSNIGFVRYLSSMKENLQPSRHIIQGYASVWRICIFITGAFVVSLCNKIDVKSFFSPKLTTKYKINLIQNASLYYDFFSNIIEERDKFSIIKVDDAPLYIFAIQAVSALIMYQSCKFAYRTHMHQFGFAFPINLVNPGAVCLIVALCTARNQDACVFHNDTLPFLDYLFFGESVFKNWDELFTNDKWYVWLWPVWMISQLWITMHLWTTENERLALAERIFSIITYDSLMIDQCLAMNKKTQNKNADEDEERNKNSEFSDTDLRSFDTVFGDIGLDEFEQDFDKNETNIIGDKRKDRITKIYACATMWHEEKSEMNHLVGSILRLDKDQCAMRITQHHYEVRIKDYYELQTHIFFDDAFRCMHGCVDLCNHDEDETEVNHYVMTLVETVQKNVENLGMRASPPTKYPTPYGGRLVWRLPGETELIVHLKDKNKIRHRKRWSQVMYMYYLLGYRLMGLSIDVDRKEIIAENTYILTLDGDIDFRPAAVKILVDLMKKDKDLAAACGRIHPVGSGPIVWFQKFEYAIGHWLQKSTETTIGSVLCSPGCFSLFRAKALMQHNVMAKYATKSSKARHYIQYDQGEDRWLCTLLLQVGSRVEYSAASDAYTHAPEIFTDFYIQRRRWIPSTVANIFDLLLNSKETRRVNNDFSWLYIAYQWILMGSTILGPGTIFLMLVGALVAAFHIDNWSSFWYNLIPICTFIGVCFTCKERIQLLVAELISAFYGLVMVIVLVGIMLQIAEDGWLAPSSLLFFIVAGQLIIAGLLHPQEATCLLCGIIYYITVPSMYMLLIIFSVFNVHNVTWGTRDSKKPTIKPQDETRPTATSHLPAFLTGKWNKQDNNKKGSLEFSLGDLFKCVCCIHTGISYEEKRLIEINDSLQKINKHLDLLDRLHTTKMETSNTAQSSNANIFPRSYLPEEEVPEQIELQGMTNKSDQENESYEDIDDESDVLTQASTTLSHEHSSFLISPYWLQDERMRRGDVNFLSNLEEEFWKNLIGKYLRPIETDEESQNNIVEELMSCRDAYLLKFFMINALFVLIVFLMQLNKDTLHLQWPLSMKYNVTYNGKRDEVYLGKEYLRLEPIGCLFIAAFVSILGIQFCAMLVHRFNTLSHMLANTRLPFCTKTSEDDNFQKYVDLIAQEVQRMADDNLTFQLRRSTMTAPRRRRTVHELTENPQGPLRIFGNWGKLFRGMLHDTNKSGLSRRMSSRMSKREFSAIERRRSSLLERGKTQTQEAYDIYDNADNLKRPSNNHISQPSTSNFNQFQYDNPTFKRDENV